MEVGFEGCLDVDFLSQCHCIRIPNPTFRGHALQRRPGISIPLNNTRQDTLYVPDIQPILFQIPYYTNVRKLCRYYNMFKSINVARYNV